MDEDEDGDRSLPDVSLSLLADNEEISELMDVAREVQESRRGSGRNSAVEDYEIFWSKKPVKEGTVLAKPDLVPVVLPEEISSTLASTLVSRLTRAESDSTRKFVVPETLPEEISSTLASTLVSQITRADSDPTRKFGVSWIVPGMYSSPSDHYDRC
jgi:hypothetical protein